MLLLMPQERIVKFSQFSGDFMAVELYFLLKLKKGNRCVLSLSNTVSWVLYLIVLIPDLFSYLICLQR